MTHGDQLCLKVMQPPFLADRSWPDARFWIHGVFPQAICCLNMTDLFHDNKAKKTIWTLIAMLWTTTVLNSHYWLGLYSAITPSIMPPNISSRCASAARIEVSIYGKGVTKKHEKSNQVNDWDDQELVGPSCTYSVLQSLIATSRLSSFFVCSSCTSSFVALRVWLASNCVFVADIDQF